MHKNIIRRVDELIKIFAKTPGKVVCTYGMDEITLAVFSEDKVDWEEGTPVSFHQQSGYLAQL